MTGRARRPPVPAARPPAAPVRVAIALGSNLGDRRQTLDRAVHRLQPVISGLTVSRYLETDPVGVGPQPPFLNAAAVGDTTLSPWALLDTLLAIEAAEGRERPYPGAARTLDLDLILYGDRVIDEGGETSDVRRQLVVPHPRFRDRLFVLEPLAGIAAGLVDPVTGLTVEALLARAKIFQA